MQTMLLVNGAPRDLKHYLYNLINKHVFRLLQGWWLKRQTNVLGIVIMYSIYDSTKQNKNNNKTRLKVNWSEVTCNAINSKESY